MTAVQPEATIVQTTNVLLVLGELRDAQLGRDFCGTVVSATEPSPTSPDLAGKTVYLCGDLARTSAFSTALASAKRVSVVHDLSQNLDHADVSWSIVGRGRVPLLVHGVGMFYRRFFDPAGGYFERIRTEHEFQSLTESNKPGKAHRTGIYLTPVEPRDDGLHFRLLRCSSNLSGPTENFRACDHHIVDALNLEAAHVFAGQAPLNHVLAQAYWNTPATETAKQTKAKIKGHADKTKDMPTGGIMAFCTFYDGLETLEPLAADPFDYGRNETSGLTRLQFRLKPAVAERPECPLPSQFSVTLYPGSVFFMPLSTNRLYTHEVRPSGLDAQTIPTRLGYVVRCSSREAIHEHGRTFLAQGHARVELEPPTREGMAELRGLYAEENRSDARVEYGNRFPFSMNRGDYERPLYDPADEFRRYPVPLDDNPFEALLTSMQLEAVTRGRQGAVLVAPDRERGVPIVRTTTKYDVPAQCFSPAHARLAHRIREVASLPFSLNNALFELYDNAYATMGMHSDQAQDLAEGSYIAVFSCYRNPELATPPRALVIESKQAEGARVQVPLLHNHVVVFSLGTNRRFKHKIVLDKSTNPPDNQWLGLTFRTSATFVKPQGDRALASTGETLTLATEDQCRELYKLRGRENRETDFVYPALAYTLSRSDLMPPLPRP